MKKRIILLLALVLSLGAGCKSSPDEKVKVLLLGLDGLEWAVLLPLLERGELPHMASLMQRGSYGQIESLVPTLSPAIWTTVATGKSPAKHGIPHFVWNDEAGNPHLYTTNMRRCKAFWNILSEEGYSVNVVGWWISYPAEKIKGVMVSQYISTEQVDGNWKGTFKEKIPGQVYPETLFADLEPFIQEAREQLDQTLEKYLGTFLKPIKEPETTLLEDSRWSILADDIYYRVTCFLLKTHPASLVALYLGGTDLIGHRFWRYMEPEHYFYPISVNAIENFRTMIPDYYRAVDRLLGDLLQKMDENCTVIIVSDHGMHPDFLKKPDSRQNSAHHEDGPPGVLMVAGPGIAHSDYPIPPGRRFPAKEAIPSLGKVADITPTILYLYDLPAALDMDGSIMTQLFKKEWLETHKPVYGSSYEIRGPASQNGEDYTTPLDREMIDRLKDLGYIQ